MRYKASVISEMISKKLKKYNLNSDPASGIKVWIGNEEYGFGTYIGLPNNKLWEIVRVITNDGAGDWYIGDIENDTGIDAVSKIRDLDELNKVAKLFEDGVDENWLDVANFRYKNESVSLLETIEDISNDDISYNVFDDDYDFIEYFRELYYPSSENLLYLLSKWMGTDKMWGFLRDELLVEEEDIENMEHDELLDMAVSYEFSSDSVMSSAMSYFSVNKIYEMAEDIMRHEWYIDRHSDGTVVMYQ